MKRFGSGVIIGLILGFVLSLTTFALAANPIKLIVNGKEIQCDVPPQVIQGRTMIPAKFLAEALGASVTWDATGNAVVVTTANTAAKIAPVQPTPQIVETPEEVAQKIIKLSSYQQWQQLYDLLHPDIQNKFTREQFIDERKTNGKPFSLIKNYTTDSATILDSWTDTDGIGKTYQNVAEVPFTIMLDDNPFRGTMHLVKASDGQWRYFWWPS